MKLLLTKGSEKQSFSFKSCPITIGSADTASVKLTSPDINPTHIRIQNENNKFTVINEVNDPFVALNGLPFRKKPLKNGDVLEVDYETKIEFELAPQTEIAKEPRPLIVSKELKPIKIRDLEDEDAPQPPPPPQLGKVSGIDPIGLAKNFRVTCTLIGMVVIMLAFIFSAYYTRAKESSLAEEFIAAESVADIAMAFKHAQVNNLKPKKHNWSDPEFIKNNLAAVTSPDCPSITNMDNQGRFLNCPYLLRTYTNGDFSHFIIIAQPNPSISHWLISKQTIVVDSKLMELRKIDDVRSLNRLLLNADFLESEESFKITQIVEQGELIPLRDLAKKRNNKGFNAPKALALMYPKAENRIYNAPRYHHYGESIVRRALTIGADADNPAEIARLRQEMQVLSRFPDTILYSSQGMETAMQTRRALAAILPDAHFLLGYLKYDDEGALVSSNLIFDQNPSEIVMYEDFPLYNEASIDMHTIQTILDQAIEALSKKKEPITTETGFSPAIEHLRQLKQERFEKLAEISAEINQALASTLQEPQPVNLNEISELFQTYQTTAEEQDAKIREELIGLYKSSVNLPYNHFYQIVDSLGLSGWLPK